MHDGTDVKDISSFLKDSFTYWEFYENTDRGLVIMVSLA